MAKKRTKIQKIKAKASHVNTQLNYSFDKPYSKNTKIKSSVNTDRSKGLGSIKNDLFKSLYVAVLILISLLVLYWVL